MSSSRGGSGKGKKVVEAKSPKVEQLSQGVAGISLNAAPDEGGWEVFSKKSKNKPGNSGSAAATKPKAQNPWNGGQGRGVSDNNWGAASRAPAGRGNGGRAQAGEVRPPLQHGWNWKARVANNPPRGFAEDERIETVDDDVKSQSEESQLSDTDDDDLLTDDYDSEASDQSHETRKQNKWFKKFFQSLDGLTVQEINDPIRQWHCPACQGGPGAIDWYKGLLPLTTHAKTKGSKRVKLHRELAELLDEELRRRGTSAVPAGESFGQWKGLAAEEKDFEIIWPPMVMVMNTKLEQDENDKWIGMGNQELLDYFSTYPVTRARHSYGPQGHRGMSVLIFEATAKGYLEAERLDKHFVDQKTDRDAWYRRRVLYAAGGMRQLYGYMATKEDLDIFNQHSHGKMKLKYELRSFQEMVVRQIRKMSEDNQRLTYYKNAAEEEKRHAQEIEKSYELVSEKLRKTMAENRIVRQRTKLQHEQTKEEMDYQESFFKENLQKIHEGTNAKEEDFEKFQQKAREKMQQSNANPSNSEESVRRAEEIANLIQLQEKEMAEYVAERDQLIKQHEEMMAAMKKRHWAEEVELERLFDANLTSLMDKFKPAE